MNVITLGTHDFNWYLKWVATSILIFGTAINSMGFFPLGPIILNIGGVMWLTVAIRWREKSLIVTNGVMVATSVAGLAWYYLT